MFEPGEVIFLITIKSGVKTFLQGMTYSVSRKRGDVRIHNYTGIFDCEGKLKYQERWENPIWIENVSAPLLAEIAKSSSESQE